ncbi:MAG: succinate dehydrogenase, hydrophobic membrane anchor protein [Gammaproteobacteria bacterium]|nr:succinate dehydrogenase, hydrophobic membrane anchor protein [Gammaproteobacteria bacterium]
MRISAISKLFVQSLGFGSTGVSDWIVQRISGVVIGLYTLFLAGYILLNPGMGYAQWSGLFDNVLMQLFTVFCLVAVCMHGWIGMWTIGTDYLRPHTAGKNADFLRRIYQLGTLAMLAAYLCWGVWILWGGR